jgi:hypothetical protein
MKILLPLVIAFALGFLMIGCGCLIGSLLHWLGKRRRATEERIKPLTDIQIIEPPSEEEFFKHHPKLLWATGVVMILVALSCYWFGRAWLYFAAIAVPATVFYVFRGLWKARAWFAHNLPHGLVWHYRAWKLRRSGRRLYRASLKSGR